MGVVYKAEDTRLASTKMTGQSRGSRFSWCSITDPWCATANILPYFLHLHIGETIIGRHT
jgi:hypothetical protein